MQSILEIAISKVRILYDESTVYFCYAIHMCFWHTVLAESPETEVADMLRTLGDQVNEQIGEILSEAVAAVLPPQAADQDIPYAMLQPVVQGLLGHVRPGWSQVLITHCKFPVFIFRTSAISKLTRNIDIANLSVCPSVTFRY